MCIYTILKNFVDKRNKLGLNLVVLIRIGKNFFRAYIGGFYVRAIF
jgi:hypothetical protein